MINKVMLKDSITLQYGVLFLFTILEVFLYDGSKVFQTFVSISEYLFVIYCTVLNRKVGISYYISFTLLSLGAWSYVIQETLPANFWGLRVFDFSVNILFGIFLFLYCLVSSNFSFRNITALLGARYFSYFILYSTIIGVSNFILSLNYFDNFLRDSLVYFPFFIYIYLISFLERTDLQRILKFSVSITVLSMLLSLVTNRLFQYSEGFYYILMNSFSYILIFSLFFLKDLYSKWHFISLILISLLLLLSGKFFIGSKSIMILVLMILWLGSKSSQNFRGIVSVTLICLLFIGPIISWLSSNIKEDSVLTYKFLQIYEVFNLINFEVIASTKTSMGNIFAEGLTIFHHLKNNYSILLFGKGFGGGVPDTFGYLAPFVGPGAGYNDIDLDRNDFVRMHLPIFEVVIKTGIFGLLFYLNLLYKSFTNKSIYSFIYFILILTVFSNSKEMMLITLVFGKLAYSELPFKEYKDSLEI